MATINSIPAYPGEVVRFLVTAAGASEWMRISQSTGSATGDREIESGLTIDRIRAFPDQSPDRLTLNRTGTGLFRDAVASGGSLNGLTIYVATDDHSTSAAVADYSTIGGGYIGLAFADGELNRLNVTSGATVNVVIAAVANQPPTVQIDTAAQTVDGGQDVVLAATASDTDGTIASYAWTATGGAFSNAAVEDPTWTAPAAQTTAQTYTLTLTVTDDDDVTANATVDITVRAISATGSGLSWAPMGSGSRTDPYVITDPTSISDESFHDALRPGRATSHQNGNLYGTYFQFTVPNNRAGTWTINIDSSPDTVDMDLYESDGVPSSRSGDGDEVISPTLTAGQTYSFYVLRYGSTNPDYDAASDLTDIALTITAPSPAGASAPTMPSAPTVSAASGASLNVSWTAPNDGGSAITGYDVRYKKTADSAWLPWSHTDATTGTTITGLDAAAEYEVQVLARNAEGDSLWSSSGTETTNAAPNMPPTVSIDTPAQTVGGGESLSLATTASDSDGTIAGYAWTATGGGFDDPAVEDPTWTAPAAQPTDQSYTLTLTVTDDDGATADDSVVMTVSATRGRIELAVDRNGDGDFSDAGEDVTADALAETGISLYRGNDSARAISPPRVGELQAELSNRSGEYSPGSSVQTGSAVRLRMGTRDLWSGNLERPAQHPEQERQSTELSAVGTAARLKGVKVSTALHENIRVDEAMGHVLDAAGWPASARSLSPARTTLEWFWADEEDAWDLLLSLYYTEGPGAMLFEGRSGEIVFRNRHQILTLTASNTAQTTVRSTGASPRIAGGFEHDYGVGHVINEASVRVVRRSAKALETVWTLGEPLELAPNEARKLNARGSSDDPFKDAAAPVEGTDYAVTAGSIASVVLDRTSGVSVELTLTAGPDGATMTGASTAPEADDSTDSDEGLRMRASPVTVDGETLVVNRREASDSISRHGKRTLPSEYAIRPEIARNVAQDLADAIAAFYKTGREMVEAPLINSDAVTESAQLGRDLGDRIRIEAESGNYDVGRDFHILGITHEIQNQRVLRTVWHCEEANENEYAAWGAAQWGQRPWGF